MLHSVKVGRLLQTPRHYSYMSLTIQWVCYLSDCTAAEEPRARSPHTTNILVISWCSCGTYVYTMLQTLNVKKLTIYLLFLLTVATLSKWKVKLELSSLMFLHYDGGIPTPLQFSLNELCELVKKTFVLSLIASQSVSCNLSSCLVLCEAVLLKVFYYFALLLCYV